MANEVVTVSAMILLVLEEYVDGLDFHNLKNKCNYIGTTEKFEINLRQLKVKGKIFAYQGKFHHAKYQDDNTKAKKVAADLKAKDATKVLKKIHKKVNVRLDKKLYALDTVISLLGGDLKEDLIRVKNDLELTASAGL